MQRGSAERLAHRLHESLRCGAAGGGGAAPPAGLRAYLAGALKVDDHPFGKNPNPELLV